MASILDILGGSIKSPNDYYADDPYFMAGHNILSSQMPHAQTNAQAIAFPLLQGLIGGGLQGYGKQHATQAGYEDARTSPLLSVLTTERPANAPYGPLTQQDAQTGAIQKALLQSAGIQNDYSNPLAPDNWTLKSGQQDLLLALAAKDTVAQAEAKKQAIKDELSMKYGPEVLQYEKDLEKAKTDEQIRLEKEKAGLVDPAKIEKDYEERLDSLRKDFASKEEVKNFSQVEKSASIIAQAVKDPGKVSDQELSRYGILLIEPGMAVREGEQAAVMGSQSVPAEWKGKIAGALKGEAQLGPDVRAGLIRLAQRSYEGHKMMYSRTLESYKKEATLRKLDPSRISYLGEPRSVEEVFGTSQVKQKASDLLAKGYTKTAQGWVPP